MMGRTVGQQPLRRSARLMGTDAAKSLTDIIVPIKVKTKVKVLTEKIPKKATKPMSKVKKSENLTTTFKSGTLSRDFEKKVYKKGFKYVVGVDEAGRGPLAGPVVAAACYIPLDVNIEGIHDSKQLNEAQREFLFEKLTTHKDVRYAVHINSPQRIDEINILQATLESMKKSVEAMDVESDYALIDGNKMPSLDIPGEFVIKGDGKVFAIAAASIIAKVTRDRLMVEYDQQWPNYGFAQHKGYGTRAHMAAIHKHGATPIHRMTFAPLNKL